MPISGPYPVIQILISRLCDSLHAFYFPPQTGEKEDLRRHFVFIDNCLTNADYSNTVLKNANNALSEKLRLSTIEKEQIQLDLTKQQEKATVSRGVA